MDGIPSEAFVNVGRIDSTELERLEAEHQAGSLSGTMYRREIEAILADAERPGAPATVTSEQKQQIIAVATRDPEDEGVPVTRLLP